MEDTAAAQHGSGARRSTDRKSFVWLTIMISGLLLCVTQNTCSALRNACQGRPVPPPTKSVAASHA
jgi:hypothetical protein